MIRLTMINGVGIAINPSHVIWVEVAAVGCEILVTTNTLLMVQESFGEVMLLLANDPPSTATLLANNNSSKFVYVKGKQ